MNVKTKSAEKLALITGGSSGLGLEIAKELGEKGYSLIILARDKGKIDHAVEDIRKCGYHVSGFQCDITDESGLMRVRDEVKEKFDHIDFLILNAGVVTCKLLSDFKDAGELKHDLQINLWGTILSAYIFLPLLGGGSKILMISSAFGLMGPAAYSVYSASKAGIINFAESLRRELLCQKISVHVACPGNIDTPQLHEECQNMPDWFTQQDPRAKAMPPGWLPEKFSKKFLKVSFSFL